MHIILAHLEDSNNICFFEMNGTPTVTSFFLSPLSDIFLGSKSLLFFPCLSIPFLITFSSFTPGWPPGGLASLWPVPLASNQHHTANRPCSWPALAGALFCSGSLWTPTRGLAGGTVALLSTAGVTGTALGPDARSKARSAWAYSPRPRRFSGRSGQERKWGLWPSQSKAFPFPAWGRVGMGTTVYF